MDAHVPGEFRQQHVFLGAAHDHNARKTWIVIAICTVMMIVEIVGGIWAGSVALIADGLHMSTHTGALLISALAYAFARRHVEDPRFAMGTGKFGDLAAFTSAIALVMVALLIAYEAIERLFNPVPIDFNEAIPIAFLGLVVNMVSAYVLRDDHHHGHAHDHVHADEDDHDDHHHDHILDRHAAYRRDNNLRAAFVHIATDAIVAVLVIVGLFTARQLNWLWLDPAVGLLAAAMVAIWAWLLLRNSGAILLDMTADANLVRRIAERIERDGDRLGCLHVWRVGPGHIAGIVTVITDQPRPPGHYKGLLADLPGLSHLTVEVEPPPR